MSFFGVTVNTIEEIYPHSNADKLELGKVSDLNFQFVVGTDNFKVGDKVLYFPIDSLIPTSLAEKMGLMGFDPKKEYHRIRTVKLRGEISQGFVCPPRKEYIDLEIFNRGDTEEITKTLGVIKYEPEEKVCETGILKEFPDGIGIYDIDGAERNMDVIESLMDEYVQITEKVEGSNFSVTSYVGGRITVNSRSNTIEELTSLRLPRTIETLAKNMVSILYNMEVIERPSRENPDAVLKGKEIAVKFAEKLKSDFTPLKNTSWENARNLRVIELAKNLTEEYGAPIMIYGELMGAGVQGNHYQFKTTTVKLFDIKIANDESATSWHWMPAEVFVKTINDFYGHTDNMVPILFEGKLSDWIGESDVVTLSSGKSKLNDKKLREGIVIKKLGEQRKIIKQRDPIYLSKTGK